MGIDVLSDVLSSVRFRGAVFFDVHATSPWAAAAPPAAQIARAVMPGADHVMEFHVLMAGTCWARVEGAPAVQLHEGDVVVFPRGDSHVIASEPNLPGIVDESMFERPPGTELPLRVSLNVPTRGRADAHVLCGFFGCDARPFNPLLGCLPRILTAHVSDTRPGDALRTLVRLAATESRARAPGSDLVVSKLTELMFVEVVRRYIASERSIGPGWLAGLRDHQIARAIERVHADPGANWTIERLARAAGMSRSAFAQRFADTMGVPPMQYVTTWRMQVASDRLADGRVSLAEIGSAVGYASEAAFLRAFKKTVGTSPGVFRRRLAERAAFDVAS